MNTIDLILERLDAESLLNQYGIQWKPSGDELVFKCPFHDDKNPSISMNRDTTLYHCFVCGANGNGIHFIAQMEGTDFSTALRKAAEMTGVSLHFDEKQKEALDLEERRINAIEKIMRLAEKGLWSNKGASAFGYLRSRGISEETIMRFRLGYLSVQKLVDYTLSNPDKASDKLPSIEELRIAGLIRSDGEDLKRIPVQEAIVFPVFSRGKSISLSFRSTDEKASGGKRWVFPYKVYEWGVNWLYNEQATHSRSREVVVCEGAMDAITLEQWGIPAVGVLGLASVTKFIDQFKSARRLYLLLDNDTAGQNALLKAAKEIQKNLNGGEVYLPSLPSGTKDPNEWLQKGGTAEEASKMLAKAPSLILRSIEDASEAKDAREKADKLKEIVEIIATLNNPLLEGIYIEEVRKGIGGVATKTDIRKSIDTIRESRRSQREEGFSYNSDRPLHPALDFRVNSPAVAQCLVSERDELSSWWSIIRVHKSAEEMRVEKITPDPEGDLARRLPAPMNAEEEQLWSTDPGNPFSATSFLRGTTPLIDPSELYNEVLGIFKKYVWLKHEDDFHLLTAFTMGTYVHQLVDAYPFLWLHGNKASGKSTILEILESMAFNALKSSNISPAALARIVDSLRPTILVDEAEQLANYKNPSMIELSCILNDSYKRGGKVHRVAGDRTNMHVESKATYSPKVIASIKHIGQTLASRTIQIDMVSPGKIKLREIKNHKLDLYRDSRELFKQVRNKLHCWKFQWFDALKTHYETSLVQMSTIEDMDGRELELWAPLMSIAQLVDGNDSAVTEQLYNGWQRRNKSRSYDDLENNEKILLLIWLALKEMGTDNEGMFDKRELTEKANELAEEYFDWEKEITQTIVSRAMNSIEAIKSEKRTRSDMGAQNRKRYIDVNKKAIQDFLETRLNLEEVN